MVTRIRSWRALIVVDASQSMTAFQDRVLTSVDVLLWDLEHTARERSVETEVTLVLFRETHRSLFDRVAADAALGLRLTPRSYVPAGYTALYDAIGHTLTAVGSEPVRAQRAQAFTCTIITDGLDNASARFTKSDTIDMVRRCEGTGRWTFAYMGATPDEWASDAGPETDEPRPLLRGAAAW